MHNQKITVTAWPFVRDDKSKWEPGTRFPSQRRSTYYSPWLLSENEGAAVKPELTEKEIGKRRNKRILWFLQIFAIVFAIIVTSILAGTTTGFETKKERERKQILTNGTNITVDDEKGGVNLFSGNMTVLNINYQPSLENTSSEEFQRLTQLICQEFETIFTSSSLSSAYLSNDVDSIRLAASKWYIPTIHYTLHFKNRLKVSTVSNAIDSAYFIKADRPPVSFLIDSSSLRIEPLKQNSETEDIVISQCDDNQVELGSKGDVVEVTAFSEVLHDKEYRIRGNFERLIKNPTFVPVYTKVTFRLFDSKGHENKTTKHYLLNSGCEELIIHESSLIVQFTAADVDSKVDVIATSSLQQINSCTGRAEINIVNDTTTMKIIGKIEQPGTTTEYTTTTTTTTEQESTTKETTTTNTNQVTTEEATTTTDIDACAEGSNNCDQTCTNTLGGFICGCEAGYELDRNGFTCSDINECTALVDPCLSITDLANADRRLCVNTNGSFSCDCTPFWTGVNCSMDVDECAATENPCDQYCSNTINGFFCDCFTSGYVLNENGRTCDDIDECTEDPDRCPEHSTCNNTIGSAECRCNSGFEGKDGLVPCNDTNECDEPSTCFNLGLLNPDRRKCVNTVGSFTCNCNTYWNDTNCETDVDECTNEITSKLACGFNTICTNKIGQAPDCDCKAGYTPSTDTNRRGCVDINECAAPVDPCLSITNPDRRMCVNTNGSFSCDCTPFWTGLNCNIDVDECQTQTDDCSQICNNTMGSFTCACHSGYALNADGKNCDDIDECAENTHDCVQSCSNTIGNFTCGCESRYILNEDGKNCDDVDECAGNMHDCNQTCSNTMGSFTCGCNSGYVLIVASGNCNDIDECAENLHDCGQACNNTIGSFNCGCTSGYILKADEKDCDDLDECTENTHACHHDCSNTFGSFTCGCNSGYTLNADGKNCDDVDECQEETDNCGQTCSNTMGNFTCACSSGYTLNADGKNCDDIDECVENKHDCGQSCSNTIGNFTCGCDSGYTLIEDGKNCDDVDECKENMHNCSQTCSNTIGSFTCGCNSGYILTGATGNCNDIDECAESLHNCGQTCNNTMGNFTCGCNSGYILNPDGKNCDDIDECAENRHNCDQTCNNTVGTFTCGCNSGYMLIAGGNNCEDVNECLAGTSGCDQNCTNTVGSFICDCNPGFELTDSITCSACNDTSPGTGLTITVNLFTRSPTVVFPGETIGINATFNKKLNGDILSETKLANLHILLKYDDGQESSNSVNFTVPPGCAITLHEQLQLNVLIPETDIGKTTRFTAIASLRITDEFGDELDRVESGGALVVSELPIYLECMGRITTETDKWIVNTTGRTEIISQKPEVITASFYFAPTSVGNQETRTYQFSFNNTRAVKTYILPGDNCVSVINEELYTTVLYDDSFDRSKVHISSRVIQGDVAYASARHEMIVYKPVFISKCAGTISGVTLKYVDAPTTVRLIDITPTTSLTVSADVNTVIDITRQQSSKYVKGIYSMVDSFGNSASSIQWYGITLVDSTCQLANILDNFNLTAVYNEETTGLNSYTAHARFEDFNANFISNGTSEHQTTFLLYNNLPCLGGNTQESSSLTLNAPNSVTTTDVVNITATVDVVSFIGTSEVTVPLYFHASYSINATYDASSIIMLNTNKTEIRYHVTSNCKFQINHTFYLAGNFAAVGTESLCYPINIMAKASFINDLATQLSFLTALSRSTTMEACGPEGENPR